MTCIAPSTTVSELAMWEVDSSIANLSRVMRIRDLETCASHDRSRFRYRGGFQNPESFRLWQHYPRSADDLGQKRPTIANTNPRQGLFYGSDYSNNEIGLTEVIE